MLWCRDICINTVNDIGNKGKLISRFCSLLWVHLGAVLVKLQDVETFWWHSTDLTLRSMSWYAICCWVTLVALVNMTGTVFLHWLVKTSQEHWLNQNRSQVWKHSMCPQIMAPWWLVVVLGWSWWLCKRGQWLII